jgi:hypothetical protein
VESLVASRGDGRHVFRLSRGETRDLRSDYEAGKPPRKHQKSNALLHMGLTTWIDAEQAAEVNRLFDGRLGDRIITIMLDGDRGIWFADTLGPGHYTVWGRRDDLEDSVVEVRPV